MRWNTNVINYKCNKIQNGKKTNGTKYKRKNTTNTKYKWNKIKTWLNKNYAAKQSN